MSEENETIENKGMFDPPPKTPYEKAVAAYLDANASDALREKIADAQKAGKGISQCYEYITEQARNEANGSNSVMIADDVVYGWAVHYFEDEWRDEIERDRKAEEDRKAFDERMKREADERKAQAAKTEAERIAAMSPEERDAYERTKAAMKEAEEKRKAKEAERAAKEQAKREADERKRKLAEAQMSFEF